MIASHVACIPFVVSGAWNPWRALRERRHLEMRRVDLPDEVGGAVYWPTRDFVAVLIDKRLGRVERRCALAHELVHDERGGGVPSEGMPPQWEAIRVKDEHAVDDEVARRLVPLDELASVVSAMSDLGEGVEAWQVAEHFDVTEAVARRALELLAAERQEGAA